MVVICIVIIVDKCWFVCTDCNNCCIGCGIHVIIVIYCYICLVVYNDYNCDCYDNYWLAIRVVDEIVISGGIMNVVWISFEVV